MGVLIGGDNYLQTYICRLFYLGTNYRGSQWQPNVRTVQGELVKALSSWSNKIYKPEDIILSGRTDRGVHSLGQLFKFDTEQPLRIDKINKLLPDDIVLWAYKQVSPNFNPRYDVLFRHYRYHFDLPLSVLSIDDMKRASVDLIGAKDFSLLSKPDGNRRTSTTILNAWTGVYADTVVFDIIGTSFLWKLVRKIATLLKDIGLKSLSPNTITQLLEGQRVLKGGIEPAPAEGLTLLEAIIPFHMTISKNALSRIKKYLEQQTAFLRRSANTLKASNAFWSSY